MSILKVRSSSFKLLLPFLFLFVAMLIVHFVSMDGGIGDDAFYASQKLDGSYFGFIGMRYETWSARVLVELVVVIFSKLPFVFWQIADTIIMVVIGIELSKIFNRRKSVALNWIIVLLVLIFPIETMSTAGWVATSIGYTWTLAAGLIVMQILKEFVSGERVPNFWNVAWMSSLLLFATDSEQIVAMIIGALGVKVGYDYLLKHKKPHWTVWLVLGISIAKLVFIVICPGNHLRNAQEVGRWFPTYLEFSLLGKIYLGILYTTRVLFQFPLIPALAATALCILCHTRKGAKAYEKVISDLITFGVIVCMFGQKWLFPLSDKIAWAREQFFTDFSDPNITYSKSLVAISFIIFIGFYYLIFINFRKNRKFIDLFLILTAGIGSQLMMLFSPTLYASTTRTGIFMMFSFFAIQIVASREILLLSKDRSEILVFTCASALLLSVP